MGVFAIRLLKEWEELCVGAVHFAEPRFTGALVMFAIYTPMVLKCEVVLEVGQKIIRRHDPPREKISGDPAGIFWRVLKKVRELPMGKNMDKKKAAVHGPGGNPPKKGLIIPHMLKHFHGNHAVEFFRGGKMVHVRRDDGEVGQSTPGFFLIDPLFLRVGMGDPHHAARRKFFCDVE